LVSYPVLLLGAFAWAVPGSALSGNLAGNLVGFLDSTESPVGQAFTLIAGVYDRAPVLVLVLSALLILPAVAVLSLATEAGRRRLSRHAALRAARRRAEPDDALKEDKEEMPRPAGAPTLKQAWLTVEGQAGATMALAGQVIHIGRHEDNDIRLSDRSVHRYHAVIERTSDETFVIRDVSGKDGVRVNGELTASAQLADGDVIELGRARLRFENAPV
jgi:type III secretion system (T3SS) inner membrane Yop/YscD-like protein